MKKAITIMAVAIGLTACKNTPKEAASAESETVSIGTEMQDQQVWTTLFNGEDFSGWHAQKTFDDFAGAATDKAQLKQILGL